MPNILVVDINQDSGCLLRGVLRNYYGVSMSDTADEAMSKIETALFD
jgi:CheY-like chemotaxis protein